MVFPALSKRKMQIPVYLLLLSVFFVSFSGCRTAPEFSVKDYPALVFETGSLFVSFNLEQDRDIVSSYLEKKGSRKDFDKIIDRTDRISFSFDNPPSLGYSAVAEGNYPGLITSFVLANNPEWIKHKSLYTWWENKDSNLQLSLPGHTVALLSTDTILPLMEKFKNGERGYIPESVKEGIKKSAVTLYTASPSPALFAAFGLKTTPGDVVVLDISIIRNTGGNDGVVSTSYKIWGYIQLKDTAKARLFSTGLKLGLLTMAIREGNTAIKKLIKENPFALQDKRVIFNGVTVTLNEILDLIKEKK